MLYGDCDSVVRTPYGPFVQALERLVRLAPELELQGALRAGDRADAVAARSGVAARRAGVSRPRGPGYGASPASWRSRGSARRGRPPDALVLILEDVPSATCAGLLLVRHLVRAGAEARMLLVATFRDAEADVPADLLAALVAVGRTEGVVRMRLGGLSGGDVAEFLRLTAGVQASAEIARDDRRADRGERVLRDQALARAGRLNADIQYGLTGMELARPAGELGPRRRCARSSASASSAWSRRREVLELAAVAGSEFGLDLVRRASGLPGGGAPRCRRTRRRGRGCCWRRPDQG